VRPTRPAYRRQSQVRLHDEAMQHIYESVTENRAEGEAEDWKNVSLGDAFPILRQ